ncbi:hypothetical protein G7Y89_g9567 [Cudoniella acicularis]|uniref:LRAT domain-containing protein n=1 Tax=Cudoniella acicularis TaxID=354080 RepID=A0A8H4RGP8_9HELO|nr:hypothetical protein G7Y89_g9567 [Cudoniella acicularis]
MKFSHLLPAFLATLAIANPIARPEAARATSLAIANPITSPEAAGNAALDVRAPEPGSSSKHKGGKKGGPSGGKKGGSSSAPKGGDTTAEFKEIESVLSRVNLKDGDWVWFSQLWDRGVVDGDNETDEELKELRDELGYDHIAVIIGQVTIKDVGKGDKKGKGTVLDRSFKGKMYHSVKEKDTRTELESPTWSMAKGLQGKSLKAGGKTTEAKAKAAIEAAEEYFAHGKNEYYDVKENNCETFAKVVEAKLR